jgi:threonine synthase
MVVWGVGSRNSNLIRGRRPAMSQESFNKRHGLPRDAGVKEVAEYLIQTSKNPEIVARAKDRLKRLEKITRPAKPTQK